MKRLAFSIVTILFAGGVIASGATGSYFSDTETATGNTFTAGAIDLKVDNESYYNGAVSTSTSWTLNDLTGQLFFNFNDLKPDDEGEDTISLHVETNDAYACMDVVLTSNDDRSSNEPELATPDAPEDINNTWDGELAQNIQMYWWADDGDNVYEVGENSLVGAQPQTLATLATTTGALYSVILADSQNNVWTPSTPGPITGGQTHYIGKGWCFGTMSLNAVAQDGSGHLPNSTNGPMVRGAGYSCNGTGLNNLTQTDGATLDIAFRAIQSRHNPNFTCRGTDPRLAKLSVVKLITNDNGGNNIVADFQLFVVGTVVTPVTSAATTTFAAGSYTVTESGISGYQASFNGDCNAAGQITLAPGDEKICYITNNDIAPSITLIKNVVGGTAVPIQFTMLIDGSVVPQNTSVSVTANSAHTINEVSLPGYSFTSITGNAKCPAVLGGTATLDEGEAITCTITNTLTL